MSSAPSGGASPKKIKDENSLNLLRAYGLLHHGLCSEEFEPRFIGTDYFWFWHEPCENKPNYGLCDIIGILIDNSGRVIFNLKCRDCGKVDALKIYPYLFKSGDERRRAGDVLKLFHLSPRLKARCRAHWWDDE
jgi:hypothetical protein